MAHSRSTVAVEMPSASAASSMLRPVKNRSSTTRHCWGSNEDSASSAWSRASTSTLAAPALAGAFSTGVIHEDLAHQSGRHRKEVRPALQRHAVHIHESQVDLMHQSRRLEAVSGTFPPEMPARDPAQLVIHERNQAVQRPGVSLTPRQEQPGDVIRARVVRHRISREAALLPMLVRYAERADLWCRQSKPRIDHWVTEKEAVSRAPRGSSAREGKGRCFALLRTGAVRRNNRGGLQRPNSRNNHAVPRESWKFRTKRATKEDHRKGIQTP